MFSHLRAVLLATGTLILVGGLHSMTAASAGTEAAIALVPADSAAPVVKSAQVRLATSASVRAIAIGY